MVILCAKISISAADLKFLHRPRRTRSRNFRSKSGTRIVYLLVPFMFSKFVSEDAAQFHELRKPGTSLIVGGRLMKTDADGNGIAGIRIPEVAVPVATYTGWGLRSNANGDGCDHFGQMIPFAKTKAERTASGDPRPSLEERYASSADYVGKVTSAANALKAERLLLDEDVQAAVAKATASSVGK
jgi:hypothetical protein